MPNERDIPDDDLLEAFPEFEAEPSVPGMPVSEPLSPELEAAVRNGFQPVEPPQRPLSVEEIFAMGPRGRAATGLGAGVVARYNPDTGERQVYRTISRGEPRALPQFPIPRRDPMEEMRKTINAIQFQKANDAYKAALSFQAARAYRQDLDAGMNQSQALARWGHMLAPGQSLAGAAAMMEAAQPTMQPNLVRLPNGATGVQYGRGGRSFSFTPRTSLPQPKQEGPVQGVPVLNPDGTVSETHFATPSASGNGWTIHTRRGAPKLSPSAEANIIRAKLEDIDKELSKLPGAGTKAETTRKTIDQRKALEARRTALSKRRDALLPEDASQPEQPKAEQPKQTRKYFNPKTGKLEDKPYADGR